MGIGPFRAGKTARLPLAVTLDGETIAVGNPRVHRLIGPDQNDVQGFPQAMQTASTGIYYYEIQFFQTGNYTAIFRAELGGSTLEDIEPFVVEPPDGFPRIECA